MLGRLVPEYFPKIFGKSEKEPLDIEASRLAFEALAQRINAEQEKQLGLDEIVSFTTTANEPSQAVMRRLGMRTDPAENFDHPNVPEGHPVRRHVLYRLTAQEWRAGGRPRR